MLSGVENLPFRARQKDCATPLADSFVQCRICTIVSTARKICDESSLPLQKQESRTRLVCKQSLDEHSQKEKCVVWHVCQISIAAESR